MRFLAIVAALLIAVAAYLLAIEAHAIPDASRIDADRQAAPTPAPIKTRPIVKPQPPPEPTPAPQPSPSPRPQPLPQGYTMAEALIRSQATGRPLVVLFTATWCPPCQTIHPYESHLASRGELAIVDIDARRDLYDFYIPGRGIPDLVVYERTAKGWALAGEINNATNIIQWAIGNAPMGTPNVRGAKGSLKVELGEDQPAAGKSSDFRMPSAPLTLDPMAPPQSSVTPQTDAFRPSAPPQGPAPAVTSQPAGPAASQRLPDGTYYLLELPCKCGALKTYYPTSCACFDADQYPDLDAALRSVYDWMQTAMHGQLGTKAQGRYETITLECQCVLEVYVPKSSNCLGAKYPELERRLSEVYRLAKKHQERRT